MMSNMNGYDLNEHLLSPLIEAEDPFLDLLNDFDFNKPQTPAGMNPSNHISSSSPPRSITFSDLSAINELEYDLNGNEHQPAPPFGTLGTTFPMHDHFQANNFELEDEKLQILAEPKALYRERYYCETDPKKKRAHRYIRTEDGNKYDHPTVKIPLKWRDPSRKLYIRVTSVTVQTPNAPLHCIHPHEIDTQENNVFKDKDNNSLYFPIDKNEMHTGEKSFMISRTKMVQNNLKSYGRFRLLDSNQPDCQRVQNLQDAKAIKAVYELSKSQLVFTIAELQNDDSVLMLMPHTSAISIVMTDESAVIPIPPTGKPNGTFINGIKCIPQQGNWGGGDEIVIIMPTPIKKKVYTIYFDFGEHGQEPINEITRIDTKTLLFRTPRCPILQGDNNIKASIIIQDNKSFSPPIDFYYLTATKTIINLCSHCQGSSMNNKRRWQYDNGESLVSQMNELSIEKKINGCHSQTPSDENKSRFDKYCDQLKESLEIFVRKNDPSRLFRRTRILLSQYIKDPSPLHDAIQYGHTELALALIEQIIDIPSPNRLLENENENGETPLLIAVKLNQWKLIESILKKRSDFAKQKDKDGNNLFHLLANLDEDKGFGTIENISKILPTDINKLLKEGKNQENQTPIDIAQSHGNIQCMNLLTLTIDVGKNNDGKN